MVKETFFKKNRKKVIFSVILILVILIVFIFSRNKAVKFNINRFDIEKITRGNISKIVTANGTINPTNVISVGSQVSGKIEKIYVDYNDVVKKNQRLAKLETDLLDRELSQAMSQLKQANSNLKLVELNTKRTRELYKNNYISKAELDEAENRLTNAKEEYNIAKTRYQISKTQLSYAYINSPTAGVIVSRDVDEGQTVASSFSTPTLFTVAEDLTNMQIETSVSESDIGMIKNKENLVVTFTVDAYKNKIFNGKIKQVRLNPVIDSNVVVYNVVIETDNKDGLLLPGMTAYVSITIDSVENVLRIPNTVLRFSATKDTRLAMGLEGITKEEREELSQKIKTGNYAYIYVIDYRTNKPKGLLVERGINDIDYTEIRSSELRENDRVISSYLDAKKTK